MSNHRLAVVVKRFPLELPTPPGEDYFAGPARMMAEAGCEVEILTARHAGQLASETIDGLRVRRFASPVRLMCALISGGYDLVHAHSHYRPALLTGFLVRGAATVFTSHSCALPASPWKRRVLVGLMNRFDRVIALTPFEQDIYLAAGVAPSKVVVMPHAINVAFFSAGGDDGRFRAQWQLPADAPVVLFVGNLRPVKNPDVVARSFDRVRHQRPEAQLVFAGANLSTSAVPTGPGIVYTDWLEADALRDALAAASVVVNSSAHEGFPLSVFEAAAAGRSLCLPALGSLQSVIGDAALYHAPGDDAALAVNILRYLREPALRAAHVAANRQLVQQFDTPVVLRQFRAFYQSLLER